MNAQADLAFFFPEGHEAHAFPGHPERPERLAAIQRGLMEAGWWESFPRLEPVTVPDEIFSKVHDPAWLRTLQVYCQRTGYFDINTYVTPASYDLALRAAGGTVAVACSVWQGKAKRGFSLARPPGHHATRQSGGGYCLINNIALAAETLLQQEGAKRMAIVDLDLHHGNGTQDIFWQGEEVLYLSTHQMPLFPGTGRLAETGEGKGSGKTANFPLPPGSGDTAFRTVLDSLILPLLDRHMPEMLLVSYGFDPHWRDPYGSLQLSAGEYGRLIGRLAQWSDEHCQGRIALVLEGGYDLPAASACSTAVTAALLGLPYEDPIGPAPYEENMAWRDMAAQARHMWGL